jgi:hypothetical protein
MSYALPSRALPSRALQMIREYSKPMSKPNWRQSKPIITTYRLYLKVKYVMYTPSTVSSIKRLQSIILFNICETEWYQMYTYIKFYGLNRDFDDYTDRMINADGIQDAIIHCEYGDFTYG